MTRRAPIFVGLSLLVQLSIACGDGMGTSDQGASGGTVGADAGTGGASGGTTGTGSSPGSGGTQATGGSAENDGSLTATLAAQAMGRGANLGQVFENTQHPRTFEAAKAKIDAYYARGFRNIRIPVTWTEAVGGDLLVNDPTVGDVNRDHPRLAVIEQVIDYALSQPGLYVVLNAHHEDTLKTEARSAVLERLWQDIADIFRDRGHRLVFEILNEPHKNDSSPMAAADLRLMTGLAYAKIRTVDPYRIVIIGGNQWFAAAEVPAVWTSLDEVGGGTDDYVMAEFHHYSPWTFCGDHQGTYDDAWTDEQMSSPMQTMATWASTVGGGMPVYIGEWGVAWQSVYATMTCNNIRLWYEKFDSVQASSFHQPTAVWDDGGWFKVFDDATGTFDNNLIDCLANGDCTWDGTERFNSGCM